MKLTDKACKAAESKEKTYHSLVVRAVLGRAFVYSDGVEVLNRMAKDGVVRYWLSAYINDDECRANLCSLEH